MQGHPRLCYQNADSRVDWRWYWKERLPVAQDEWYLYQPRDRILQQLKSYLMDPTSILIERVLPLFEPSWTIHRSKHQLIERSVLMWESAKLPPWKPRRRRHHPLVCQEGVRCAKPAAFASQSVRHVSPRARGFGLLRSSLQFTRVQDR